LFQVGAASARARWPFPIGLKDRLDGHSHA